MFMLQALKTLRTELDNGEVFICSNNLYPRKLWHLVYGPSYLLRLFGLYKHIMLLALLSKP